MVSVNIDFFLSHVLRSHVAFFVEPREFGLFGMSRTCCFALIGLSTEGWRRSVALVVPIGTTVIGALTRHAASSLGAHASVMALAVALVTLCVGSGAITWFTPV